MSFGNRYGPGVYTLRNAHTSSVPYILDNIEYALDKYLIITVYVKDTLRFFDNPNLLSVQKVAEYDWQIIGNSANT